MKNKQHEYILKAFLESKIPYLIRINAPEFLLVDSIIGGYSNQLLNRVKTIEIPLGEIITKEDKEKISELINISTGTEKKELVIYYKLALLTESVLIRYCE